MISADTAPGRVRLGIGWHSGTDLCRCDGPPTEALSVSGRCAGAVPVNGFGMNPSSLAVTREPAAHQHGYRPHRTRSALTASVFSVAETTNCCPTMVLNTDRRWTCKPRDIRRYDSGLPEVQPGDEGEPARIEFLTSIRAIHADCDLLSLTKVLTLTARTVTCFLNVCGWL
jgi:hypothetical protein